MLWYRGHFLFVEWLLIMWLAKALEQQVWKRHREQ